MGWEQGEEDSYTYSFLSSFFQLYFIKVKCITYHYFALTEPIVQVPSRTGRSLKRQSSFIYIRCEPSHTSWLTRFSSLPSQYFTFYFNFLNKHKTKKYELYCFNVAVVFYAPKNIPFKSYFVGIIKKPRNLCHINVVVN